MKAVRPLVVALATIAAAGYAGFRLWPLEIDIRPIPLNLLPLDFFLGIGAMENNYLDVQGDLKNAIWKRHAEKGDIVLKRKRGRVLVLNQSSGVWQITRETLRYAHRLYLRDSREYSRLPARLRPPNELDLGDIESSVLTTYAGLIFRDLLDRCHGE
jgi:hypothetical protein